ncbi:hypothetical protein [Pseudoalteromonas sp. TB64]|uniref:hypothetical protein n=1 Tax=Pseudoalteromonas sp. TB64 TaxID=1938600 RepID=UPI0003F87B42|nr:hypothetical protein [Pseudoalteromonas sp. TB64]
MSIITKVALIALFLVSAVISLRLSFGPDIPIAEYKDLEKVSGVVTHVGCSGRHNEYFSSVKLNDSKFYEIPMSIDSLYCDDVRKEWVGKTAFLNILQNRGAIDVYELRIDQNLIYDISWYKKQKQLEEKWVIAFPYILIVIALLVYFNNQRKKRQVNF